MTAQIPDLFKFDGENYSLAGVNGRELFNPKNYDLETLPASTACYRGYQVLYAILEDQLVIDTLYVKTNEAKKINGKKPFKLKKPNLNDPQADLNSYFFRFGYKQLNLALNFTGTILIAKDFIEERYVHMGFQKPTSYRKVIELKFDNGALVSSIDKSEAVTRRREIHPKDGLAPSIDSTEEELKEFIDKSFSLDYELDDE
jgi:hypothetical protein